MAAAAATGTAERASLSNSKFIARRVGRQFTTTSRSSSTTTTTTIPAAASKNSKMASSLSLKRSRIGSGFTFDFHFPLSIALLLIVLCGDLTWLLGGANLPGTLGVLAQEHNGDESKEVTTTPTTTTIDPSKRGPLKFGDKCNHTEDCSFAGSVCDPQTRTCQCTPDLPATNHIDKCGKKAQVNESCFFSEQCEMMTAQTECRDYRCICMFEMNPIVKPDGTYECRATMQKPIEPEKYIDPAMIGVLVAMAVMFIIICVVLRLFSKARWRDNRTIFNTPNPRLMNVSLLRDNKLLHGQERRGSRMSVRLPSRQPSMASLRPHSPNASIAGSRRGSRGSSNASATSTRSNRSQHAKDNGNATIAHQSESVTVEISEMRS